MSGSTNHDFTELNLEKLGIREIRERIEVSPILTDPGSGDPGGDDPTPKQYICNINFKDVPNLKDSLR